MKKPVAASNFLDLVSLFMVTFPIEVKPRFLRSSVMVMVSHGPRFLFFCQSRTPENRRGASRCQLRLVRLNYL